MTGQELEALRDALCDAFDYNGFREMLRLRLDKSLEHLSAPGRLSTVVFNVIETAEREGWLADLVRAARTANSGNPKLKQFVAEHPGMLPPPPPRKLTAPPPKLPDWIFDLPDSSSPAAEPKTTAPVEAKSLPEFLGFDPQSKFPASWDSPVKESPRPVEDDALSDLHRKLLRAAREKGPGASPFDIAKACKEDATTTWLALSELKDRGLVTRDSLGRVTLTIRGTMALIG
jgi:hypothetical protein